MTLSLSFSRSAVSRIKPTHNQKNILTCDNTTMACSQIAILSSMLGLQLHNGKSQWHSPGGKLSALAFAGAHLVAEGLVVVVVVSRSRTSGSSSS